jgi:hypothetical protein
MAGTDSRFPRARFEEGIRAAMRMGAPIRPEDRATFHFRTKKQYPSGTRLDQSGKPLNPSIRAEYVTPDPLVLQEVAIESEKANPQELPVGVRIPTRVVITLLDDEYQQIKDRAAEGDEEFAIEVELGGDRYRIGYRPPPMALFDSGVHQLVCYALEES